MADGAAIGNGLERDLPAGNGRVNPIQPGRTAITEEGERELRARLAALERQHEEDIVARLRDARAFGEAADNDDMLQVREEEAVLTARISRLRALLENATVIREGDAADGSVAIGTTVEVEDLDSGSRREIRITDAHEGLLPGDASANSPVGQALIGHQAGATVTVELPNGDTRRLRVVDVRSSVRA